MSKMKYAELESRVSFEYNRFQDLCNAIIVKWDANEPIPNCWINEYNDYIERFTGKSSGVCKKCTNHS